MRCLLYSDEILSLLKEKLLSKNVDLSEAYEQLNNYRVNQKEKVNFRTSVNNLHPTFRRQLASDFPTTTHAIDLPIYIANQQSNSRIMIVAMDSLPPVPESSHWKNNSIDLRNEIGFWAPFSLIEDWSSPKGSMKSNLSFFQPLLENHSLYITDIYKLFYRKILSSGYKVSNRISTYTNLENLVHFEILLKEIEIVQPKAILVLGKSALNSMNPILTEVPSFGFPQYYVGEDKIPLLALPHISGAANGAKATFVNDEKFTFIESKTWNEKLARIALHQLT